jgi:predicted dehydrogenase
MDEKIKWGILGTGDMARNFASGLNALPDAALHAVASRTQKKADVAAKAMRATKAYGSYEALVSDPAVDVVYISTPHHRHYEDMLLCLNHGKHILCEKAFTMSAQQARDIAALARAKNLFCMEAMWMRFMPLVQEAKRLMERNAIGTPLMLSASLASPVFFDPASRCFDAALGGGVLLDRGVYLLSLAYFLFGAPQEVLSAGTTGSTNVDEQAALILRYADGKIAMLYCSLRVSSSSDLVIMGTGGNINLPGPFFLAEELTLIPFPEPSVRKSSEMESMKARLKLIPGLVRIVHTLKKITRKRIKLAIPHDGSVYRHEAAEVMRCLRHGILESAIMPLEESVAIMELLDKARTRLAPPPGSV